MRAATARMRNLVGFTRCHTLRTSGSRSRVHAGDARHILCARSPAWPPRARLCRLRRGHIYLVHASARPEVVAVVILA
jgi:hypothetical protein